MNIYDWIKSEEHKYQSRPVQLADNWHWNMRNFIQMIFHLKNSVFYEGENDYLRMFRQVMKPIIELSNWTEDIDVKDITFFIESNYGKVKSFLFKKYHDEVYTREYDIDSILDFITESDNEYGGVLIQKGEEVPIKITMTSIAFADQNDILSAPLGFKYVFSPDKLRSMKAKGWGKESNGATISIEDLIVLANSNIETPNGNVNEATGKVIEVYIVHGNLPDDYLTDSGDIENIYNQSHVVAFYTDKDNKKQGVTLFRKKVPEGNIKFMCTTEVDRRALGNSVAEDLIPAQIFSNFMSIHKMNLVEAGAKVPLYTDDDQLTQERVTEVENLELIKIGEGKRIGQIPTMATNNIQLISNQINELFEHAKFIGSAYDPIMGKEASSGTTFRGQERSVAQASGSHNRKRGKRAKFVEEIYRDYIIPHMKKKILSGKTFLAELDNSELRWVIDNLAICEANKKFHDLVFNKGKVVTDAQYQELLNNEKINLSKKGNKYLIKILEEELNEEDIKVGINVSAKQKDLVQLSDKLLSIFQFIFADPNKFKQAMQVPALAKSFEDILEYGGLSIGDFSSILSPIQPNELQAEQTQDQTRQSTQLQLNNPQK